MYSGSTEFNNLIEKSGGNALKTRFTFTDFTIEHFTKLEYYGGSNNSDDIAIGTTNMAYLDVSTITDKIITNQEFLFEVGMELSDGTVEYAPMGYFTVQKPDSDEDTVNFKAYDRMQKFEKPYVSSLTYPTDSSQILNELCTMCKVELATPITSPIAITDKLDGYTCREVLGYIAGIHGFFACFDRYGKLNLRWYSETSIEKQIGLIWSLTKSQSDYTVEKITLAKDTETTYTSGTGISGINHSNPYATQAIADSIYASLGGFSCRPCEISMLDDVRLDPWDMLKVTYLDGSVLTIPVMSLEHSFTSGETRVKSFGKTDTENEYSYSGPVTQAMDRMATELLVANRVIATKVDAEWVNAHTVTADKLEATNARVSTLEANSLTAETADLRYANITLANIDTANVDVANIGLLFTKVGLIDRATIVDGHITGFLDAVEVNANNITAGTLIADRILLKGSENGLLYALNNLGELTSTTVDTLDGTILTQRTVTADKLVANSITANELDVENIFANNAVLNTLTSQTAFINAISTNSVVVRASNTANSALDAVNGLEIGGRNILKDSENMKFALYGGTKATTESNISVPEWGATDATRIYGTGGDYKIVLLKALSSVATVKGTSYTNSIYMKNNHATNSITVYNNIGSRITVKAGESKRVILTGIGNGISWLQYQLYTDTVGAEFDITYWHPKVEYGNVATDWSPAPEDISVENVYTAGTTTIDGGKVTTGSIKAAQIDVNNLFAQDITATGTITGANLYGTYIETKSGEISGFIISNDTLSKRGAIQEIEEDPVTNNYAYYGLFSFDTEITSSTDNYSDNISYLFRVKANMYTGSISSPTLDSTTTVFGVNGKAVYANILNIGYGIDSDLLPMWKTKTAISSGDYSYTYYDLGSSNRPWENLYCRTTNIADALFVSGETTLSTTKFTGASSELLAQVTGVITGTTSTVGVSALWVGNNTSAGNANNQRGTLRLYGTSSGYTVVTAGYASTSSITVTLPSSSGTLALTSSDQRLKENIKDAEISGLDFINSIKLHQFDWKESGDHWNCGYIADELMEYDKHLVLEGSGGVNDDGTINPLCIDDFYLSAYQTKAIQELYKRIIELEEKIQALKNAN